MRTDANGKSVHSIFDQRFGVPVQVTDANNLITIGVLSAGQNQITAYEDCAANRCAGVAFAKTRVVSAQAGAPRSIAYQDKLGRTVRTVSQTRLQ